MCLAYDDSQVKLGSIQAIVSSYLNAGKQVHYIDYDLQYSSALQNFLTVDFDKVIGTEFHVLQPGGVDDLVSPLFTSLMKGGVIVLDSFNSLQNLLSVEPSPTDLATANHRSAVFVSAIQMIARIFSKTIIILNLTKSRPTNNEGIVTWERNIVGGRMTYFKSDVILFAKEDYNSQKVEGITITADTVSSESFRGRLNDAYQVPVNEIFYPPFAYRM